jgi:transposase InsO family protein
MAYMAPRKSSRLGAVTGSEMQLPLVPLGLAPSAVAFLEEALAALPLRITHVLTDRGSCFTADAFEQACEQHGVVHRKTRPYTPKTNSMVERFNGRVQREVLGVNRHNRKPNGVRSILGAHAT